MTPEIDREAGVLETVLMDNGELVALDRHLARLAASVRALFGQELPPGIAGDLRRLPSHARARVRVSIYPDGPRLAGVVEAEPLGAPPASVALVPLSVERGLGAHKWRDRSWLAARREELRLESDDELLLVDATGQVLETDRAAVLLIEGGSLVAAPADGERLPSVTRSRLLARRPGAVETISLDRLLGADLVLTASALRRVAPARSCGDRTWTLGAAELEQVARIRAYV